MYNSVVDKGEIIDTTNHINNIRKGLAVKLTLQKFKELYDGEFAKRLAYQSSKTTDGDAITIAYNEFKLRLLDTSIHLSELSLTELLSDLLNISIYTVRLGKNDFSVSNLQNLSTQCKKIFNHDNSVILATKDDISYYLIHRVNIDDNEIEYVFNSNDKVIEKLYREIC